MTKKQKIWLGIFLAMFIVPEVLLSPVGNFYYELSQTSNSGGTHPFNKNFLQNSDNLIYLKFVIFLEFIGLALFLFYFLKNSQSRKIIKWITVILSAIFFILISFTLYYVLSFSINIL